MVKQNNCSSVVGIIFVRCKFISVDRHLFLFLNDCVRDFSKKIENVLRELSEK